MKSAPELSSNLMDSSGNREFVRLVDTFDRQEYDVTDRGCQYCQLLLCPLIWTPIIPGVIGTKTLILEPEEAVLETKCCCCYHSNSRRPYGELGSVDATTCCFCTGFTSGLTVVMGNSTILCPGNGCDNEKVETIVAEMRRRMRTRGDTGQILRAEENAKKIFELHQTMTLLLKKTDALLEFHHIEVRE
eukprot:CAMPEP_0114423782 /NCGR_PEP_ID=MMETSP0103-20121206/6336_1 /TAXON_ID=37642 ORGANISM="Paraphysomonas imperforata, Strain PA2" /NCGR_SAMPLE_ID=MMETSP0103 /ASSEMBLY_ACC=CAM_ASM_000201 /LENGTH=188 /DNA_ID=CAMNT_0001592475 /DNA_START=25 /DNA_END=591 /DNA_ORIENTATION=+